MGRTFTRKLLTFLKFAIPALIIAWLLVRVPNDELRQLRARPKNWPLLSGAFALTLVAICLTFVRWYFLVRALSLKFDLRDAFRLGFLGFLFNFISPGSVGGDLFKAFFIAREQRGRRTEAVATVVVDRVVGLYALLILISTVILWGGMPRQTEEVVVICRAALIAAAAGAITLLIVLLPGFASGPIAEMLTGLPKLGPTLERLITAVRIYRRQWHVVLLAGGLGIGTHVLLAAAFYLVAAALWPYAPTLHEHLVIVPLGMVAGALPTPGGLGAFEFAIDELYRLIPADKNVAVSGVLVALTYRLMTIGVAMVGVAIYWVSRSEVRAVLREAEQSPNGL